MVDTSEFREVKSYKNSDRAKPVEFLLRAPGKTPQGEDIAGSQIQLLPGEPAYTVTSITGGESPSITMTRTPGGYNIGPETIVFSGHGPKVIARETNTNDPNRVAVGEKMISRPHATFKFDPEMHGFTVKGHGRNPICVRHAKEVGVMEAQDLRRGDETVADYKPSATEEDPPVMEIPLRPGMIMNLLTDKPNSSSIPPYVVKTAVGGPKPQLVLEGGGHGYPTRIELSGKWDVKTMGRVPGNDIVVNHDRISKLHATISWDEHDKNWTFYARGAVPIMHPGAAFIADMRDRADRVATQSVVDAKEQIKQIDSLVLDFQNVRRLMENVQGLEAHTQVTSPEDRERGARTEDSQGGYKAWVKAYQILYNETLDKEQKAKLDEGYRAISDIGEHRAELRDMMSYGTRLQELPTDLRGVIKASMRSDYSKDMNNLLKDEVKPLFEKPPKMAYPVSGYRGHHTVTRIHRDKNDDFIFTTYNAGQGAIEIPGDTDNVIGRFSRRLKKDVAGTAEVVRLINESKLQYYGSAEEKALRGAIDSALGPRFDEVVMPMQHKGNCTTRSTREMLKDVLGDTVFGDLHRHVSDPQLCDPAEAMAALQMRRDALENYVVNHGQKSIDKPKGLEDWGHSVDEIMRSVSEASFAGVTPSTVKNVGYKDAVDDRRQVTGRSTPGS